MNATVAAHGSTDDALGAELDLNSSFTEQTVDLEFDDAHDATKSSIDTSPGGFNRSR